MIVNYFIHLLLILIVSLVALVFVVTLGFQERWKAIVGALLCAVILMTVILISSRIVAYEQDGAEFSKLVQEATLYLHKKNK